MIFQYSPVREETWVRISQP